jgi:two-component system cell cycle response regulator
VRVLVVEDSPTARAVIAKALRELGHDVEMAEDGLQGWDRFTANAPDVIISDWNMPGIEGDELCRRVRAADGPYIYFILLSANGEQAQVLRGMEAGADDYLTKPLDRDQLEARLAAAARVTAVHRKVATQQAELERLNDALHKQARHDPLTGLRNRLQMLEDLGLCEARFERYGHGYAVAMCDIDRFKAYNDHCGHLAGDDVLRAVADELARLCRSGDAAYRYGGEELLVVFPQQGTEGVLIAAERIRRGVERLGIAHPGLTTPGVVTVSIGLAVRDADLDAGVEALLIRADAALYRAKDEGRNCLVLDGAAARTFAARGAG